MAFGTSVVRDLEHDNHTRPRSERSPDPARIEGVVYLAYPLVVHRTPRARQFTTLARRHFPHAEIVPACEQFSSNRDWLRRWPDILSTLAAVCAFTGKDGWVGMGVWIEVHDALARGLPVYLLTTKRVYPWDRVEVIEPEKRNYQRYARFHPPRSASGNDNG
jgi:hypothetical protein